MQCVKTRGIIARRADYGEANVMLTILTEGLGLVSACAYGVRSKKSKEKASTQVLCYCEFVLSKKGGDIYKVDSIEVIDGFFPIAEDLTKLSLANYLLDLARDSLGDGDNRILSLLLNTLYVLAYRDADIHIAKSVFELKLMQYGGYAPCTNVCVRCGKGEEIAGFNMDTGVVCKYCKTTQDADISLDLYRALCYILSVEDKKIFSFTLSEAVKKELSQVSEKYLLSKIEKNYKSLDYFKRIL